MNAMDLLKWPTDSLYKFLAVAGLSGFIACLCMAFVANRDIATVGTDFLKEELQRLQGNSERKDNSEKIYPPMVHWDDELPPAPEIEYLYGSEQERITWEAYIKHQLAAFKRYSGLPKLEEMHAYFERPDIKRYFRDVKQMSGETYETMAKEMTLEKFAEMTAGERELYRENSQRLWQHWVALRPAWDAIDSHRSVGLWSEIGAGVSFCIGLCGIGLWYWFVQRPQDIVAARDAQAAKPNHGPAPNLKRRRNKNRRR